LINAIKAFLGFLRAFILSAVLSGCARESIFFSKDLPEPLKPQKSDLFVTDSTMPPQTSFAGESIWES
jgi:hypothetical protein